jgi:catechol 2,3-dioxygenase-like lactoylglutathione lyase family enzyme
MLANLEVHATLPVQDMARARKFYADRLGLTPSEDTPGGLIYRFKESWFALFPTSGHPSGTHTQAGWVVHDLEKEVAELKARGLTFEEYDSPTFKTVNSIATVGTVRAAYFKDSEGNLLGLVQFS